MDRRGKLVLPPVQILDEVDGVQAGLQKWHLGNFKNFATFEILGFPK